MQLFAELLEVGLPKLKLILLIFVFGVDAVVPVSVCPFKNLPRPDHLVASVIQKAQLLNRIVLQLLEHLYFLLNDWPKFSSLFLSFVVIVEAFEVKHIPLKLVLGFLSLFLLSCKARILLFGFENVALIVAAGRRSVFGPVAQTNPTELEVTASCSTRHMVATLVLFN